MTKGQAIQTKIHYQGKEDDFVIFVDDVETMKKWKEDKSVPMVQFISAFKIFVTHKQGAQGQMDGASKATLENEFGTSIDEEVIKQILEKGSSQETEFPERQGPKNDAQMGSITTGPR
ncbi:shwachman-Bodian-diamond syndrome protein [Pseudomassariella vexata]|uniref:Shwachman-Bodian-diamond syndrome protein n=1 Tax=Pseudomassariella vexata TaxID=1141098 RepID=A0A1Y2E4I8_9PEZI|nr:shwachman-Bodian-diamond syndrome protein [Pseudomassariella vexata]ORY66429.1 shwachman-Bodian-diamond syndrome protein [Pseudomassariella vexata]